MFLKQPWKSLEGFGGFCNHHYVFNLSTASFLLTIIFILPNTNLGVKFDLMGRLAIKWSSWQRSVWWRLRSCFSRCKCSLKPGWFGGSWSNWCQYHPISIFLSIDPGSISNLMPRNWNLAAEVACTGNSKTTCLFHLPKWCVTAPGNTVWQFVSEKKPSGILLIRTLTFTGNVNRGSVMVISCYRSLGSHSRGSRRGDGARGPR